MREGDTEVEGTAVPPLEQQQQQLSCHDAASPTAAAADTQAAPPAHAPAADVHTEPQTRVSDIERGGEPEAGLTAAKPAAPIEATSVGAAQNARSVPTSQVPHPITAIPTLPATQPASPFLSISPAPSSASPSPSPSPSPVCVDPLVSVLSAKKRALLCEIGALLTLRERLHSEMSEATSVGVPFDYATRFAHSPATLKLVEEATNAWREEMRMQEETKEQDRRAVARAQNIQLLSPSSRTSASPTSPSRSPALVHHTPSPSAAASRHFAQSPLAMHLHTPARGQAHIHASITAPPQPILQASHSALVPAALSVPARPRTAPAAPLCAQPMSVSFLSPLSHAPIHEHGEEEEEDSMAASVCTLNLDESCVVGGTHSPALPPRPVDADEELLEDDDEAAVATGAYNGIEHEESLYIEGMLDDETEGSMGQYESRQEFWSPSPPPPPPPSQRQEYTERQPSTQLQQRPQQQLVREVPARPHSAMSYTQHQRDQHQQPHHSDHQRQRPVGRPSSTSSSSTHLAPPAPTPAPARPSTSTSDSSFSHSHSDTSSSPSLSSAPAALCYSAQKALARRAAEAEALRSFQGQSLGGVAAEGRSREANRWNRKEHYSNFYPAPANESSMLHSFVVSAGVKTDQEHLAQATAVRLTSPMRPSQPLRNITNTTAARHASSTTGKGAQFAQQHTPGRSADKQPFIRW